ncbi:hypothetical protein L6164_021899 [Bauhinia variegata]|uniref:Uncharacterized protein n=1 Tax=Bauhinia variegata TaxID=167791 RepID=A0ACB9MEX7_BAUVA|nr:hypothetical protein L6164_021899 [Bauhinia variegata]
MAKKFPLKSILHLLLLVFCTLSCTKTKYAIAAEPPAADTNHPSLCFFMHDIVGGSAPSERVVAGNGNTKTGNTQVNNLPFSKPINRVFPVKGGTPTDTNPKFNSIINGPTTPEKLLFGRITVIDDEITQSHELGSSIIGKAQGFHLASSLDGTSLTMTFTALFHNQEEEDTISFFGVHRTAELESYIAIVGGTGKYDNAQGYAKIQTLHPPDQHLTDGSETLVQITVYLIE